MKKYKGWILKNLKTGELYLGFFFILKEELRKELETIYNKEEWKELEEKRNFKIVPVELKEIENGTR